MQNAKKKPKIDLPLYTCISANPFTSVYMLVLLLIYLEIVELENRMRYPIGKDITEPVKVYVLL